MGRGVTWEGVSHHRAHIQNTEMMTQRTRAFSASGGWGRSAFLLCATHPVCMSLHGSITHVLVWECPLCNVRTGVSELCALCTNGSCQQNITTAGCELFVLVYFVLKFYHIKSAWNISLFTKEHRRGEKSLIASLWRDILSLSETWHLYSATISESNKSTRIKQSQWTKQTYVCIHF